MTRRLILGFVIAAIVAGVGAVRVPEGLKVHYNGTVCDVHVSGTQIVKKRP